MNRLSTRVKIASRRSYVTLLVTFFLLTFTVNAQKAPFETVQLQSKLLGKTLPYNVILPRDYQTSPRTRYPVLYLLHGFSGHYSDWVSKTNLADYAAAYRMIVITPEGNDGWYTDSVGTATDKYESYILQDLIPDVDKKFRTIQTRYARGIAG